jgi:hypothetical protein
MKSIIKAILLLGLPGLLSCACLESVGPGTFGVVFAWEGGQPALLGDEYVWAAVEERENPQTAGRVLGSVGPQPFFMDSELKFLDIPNGDNRVVIVEIRDGQGVSANVLYYGISEQFSLDPGKHVQVEVYMRLRAVPGDTEGWVFIEAIGEMINHTDVKLVLLTDTGVKAKVSHFVSFPPEKTVEADLSDLESYPDAPPDLSGYRMDWDLAWEPVYACEDKDYCPRRVFVRLVDGQGYESKTVYADAVLDLSPPALVQDGVSIVPAVANVDTFVTVCLTFTEQLARSPDLEVVNDLDFTFYLTFPDPDGPSNSYCFRADQQAGTLGPDGDYPLQVSAEDRAGNSSGVLDIGVIRVDSTDPGIINVTVTGPTAPDYANLADRTAGRDVTISFDLSEEPGDEPQVWVGAYTDPDPDVCTAAGLSYTCRYTLSARDTDGFKRITIIAVDRSGNANENSDGSIELDFTPPAIMSGTVSRKLVPGDDLLDDVTSAKEGTTVVVFFTMSEPLWADPIVQTTTPQALTFSFAGKEGISYKYIYQIQQPLPPDGAYTVQISAADEAGNPMTPDARPPEAVFEIDTAAPKTPEVDVYGLIVYRRVPWGSGSIFTIEGGSGAVEAEAWAIFYNDSRQEIDRVQADATGGFGPYELVQADRPEIYVGVVDDAGNESPVTLVRDVEWTATFGGSSRLWFEERTWFGRPLFHAPGYAETDLQNLAAPDGSAEDTLGSARGWTQWLKLAEGPTARQSQIMSYDSARGRMVMFGGSDGTYNAQTWEWDGRQWILRCGTGTYCSGPVALAGHSLVYDSTRGVTVLYGGDTGDANAFYSDTWEWDGEAWKLVCAEGDPCAGGLTGRSNQSMVYDRERGKVVMFGGCKTMVGPSPWVCTDFSDETWEWDGLTWVQVCGTGTGCSGPSGRMGHAMAFDSIDNTVILHAGCTSYSNWCTTRSDETWTWNGSTWSKICGSGTACGAPTIDRHGLAYDASRDRVVLFGGRDSTGYSGKIWEWNGTGWSMVCDTMAGCAGPSRRSRLAMAFDPVKERVVMFGGSRGWPNFSEEVWEWDGTSWRIQYSANVALAFPAPANRRHHAMAYDPGRERTVLFGGSDTASFDDTWEFDGERWKKACGAGTTCSGPTARRMHAMAYDAVTKTVVMFGGFDDTGLSDQLWEWNGTSWKQACGDPTSCSGPAARYGHSMMWDGNQQRIVVFGGCVAGNGSTCTTDSDEVWEWSGSNRRWTRVCGSGTGCSGPSARNAHKMVYDDNRNVGVMFGGCTSWGVGYCNTPSDEVWEWNGSQWRRVCGTGTACSGPTTLADFAMTYDAGRGAAVIHSGVDGNIIYFDTWEWNGSSWNMLCGAGINCLGPPARYQHAMAYDPDRGQVVMFGGRYLSNNNETWLWDGGATSRPGQVIAVPFAQALDLRTAPRPDPLLCLRDPARCPVRSVEVDWLAGGEGDDSQNPGTVVNGTELLAWSQNEWIRLSGNGAGTGSPAAIHFDLTTGDPPNEAVAKEIGRLLFGDLLNFYLAVTPTTDSGTLQTFGQVVTDFLSVTVKYRLDHFDL